jgi:hypothetical protein
MYICGMMVGPLFAVFNTLSCLAFLGYGASCLFTLSMKREFDRFGLAPFRIVVGSTQLMGAGALAIGPWVPEIGLVGAGALSAQMLAGIVVRARLGDTLAQTLQAILALLINVGLTGGYWQLL